MQIIKCLSENIEETLDMAEANIKKAIMYKDEYPAVAQTFYNQSTILMNSIKDQHNVVVTLITDYKKEHGEPPAPMIAIYNYMHERHTSKAAAIKALQEMYNK